MSAYFAEKGGHNEKWRGRRKEKEFDYDEDTFPEEEEEENEEEKEERQHSYADSARIHSTTTTTTTTRTTRERGGRATPSLTSSRYSHHHHHHHHHSDSFPRVREILWDASPEKTETTVVWSSDVGPTMLQFLEEGGRRNLAQRIIEKSQSSSAYLYARYDSGSNSNSNNSSGIVTISSSSSKKSNESRRNYSCERRVPLDASFLRSKRGSQEGKRCGRIASQFAWGSTFTSVRQSFHAKCDAMPSIGNEEEEEEEMDNDEDQDEPWTPLDMWPMRIGAVVEQFDDVKSEQNSLSWKVHLTVAFEMPSCAFRFAPIRPLRVSREFSTSSRVISALFDDDDDYRNGNRNSTKKGSSSLSSTKTDVTTGFLTLDRARRLCFLKTNSSRVYNSETPLVGVWVHRCDDDARGSDAFLRSSEVWAACLRYASNSVLRKVSQNGSFLVCIVNGRRKVGGCEGKNAFTAAPQLECYDCIATQGKEPFVPHQIDVTLNTNADDLNSADAFVLGVVKEIDRTSIAFKFDRSNDNKTGKEDREEEGKEEEEEEEEENDIDDDDGDGHEIDDIIGYKNLSGKTFQHRDGKTTTRKLTEAEKEVAFLEALLQNRHRRDDFNGSPFRATSLSTRNFTPRSLAADLVKRAERSFANNRRGKKIPLREDAKGRHRSSSINADKVLHERLRLVQFVVEDQLKSGGVARGGGGNSEELVSIRFDNNRSENEHHRDDNDDDDDDNDDADAHILRKYTTSSVW